MSMRGKQDAFWKQVLEAETILLTTHVRPDGDGIASELALSRILKSLKKKVYVLNQDRTPDMYRWLPGGDEILTLEERFSSVERTFLPNSIDITILLDCSSMDRIGEVSAHLGNARRIMSLDHHEQSESLLHDCYIDPDVSSIGELLYLLIPNIQEYMDKDVATCLYVSILTDTGSFAFSNTTKRVFEIVSSLMDYGVEPDYAHRMIYNRRSIQHFRLLGKALERMKIDETGQIVHVALPLSVYTETGADNEDNEGIIEVIRGVKDCKLIIMLRQLDEKRLKGSLRSTDSINCVHLARIFGGGGHFKASGFVVSGTVNERGPSIVEQILAEVREMGWI
jgi:phosphoesterase RecJ-like protein